MAKKNDGESAFSDSQPISVVVLGNPNTGKSTLFNGLTGVRQQTGNYPGVTVEKRTGRLEIDGRQVELTDLPGTYSLAPRSPDEMLTFDVLLGKPPATKQPDLILCVVPRQPGSGSASANRGCGQYDRRGGSQRY
jgi:ferrous iron transport protein B